MTEKQQSNIRTVLAIALCVVLAALVILSGSNHSVRIHNIPVFALAGVLPFLLHWLMFLPAYAFQTEHYFDLTGAVSFIAAILLGNWAITSMALTPGMRTQLLSLMVLTWALRLGSFLFLRVKRAGEDRRFRDIKQRPLRFLLTWTLGGLWVLITVAPALAAISSSHSVPMGPLAYAALALWGIGLMLEVVADRQKSAFRANPDNRRRFIHTGLWALSRHPNYLGEIMLWLGVALLAAPALQGWQYGTLISPFFVILLLCKVSGIPLLEARAEQTWGHDPEYRRYVQQTPVLIPFLRGRHRENHQE
ncbi:MAG: DUF1295 domain-containing protein [Pseudomonadales bacterium]|nr:DUF1295 domain-containing protein [Pseudomonadales bacterium]